MHYSKDRWFRDENGDLVVAQPPNLPIIVWVVARVLEMLVHGGRPERLFDTLAFGALFTWSWLELFHGDAYVRRILGAVVLAVLVISRVR